MNLPESMRWMVASVKTSVSLGHLSEQWYLAPRRRYLLTSDVVAELGDNVEKASELEGFSQYRPLNGTQLLHHRNILVSRHFYRGLGDILFMTGPLQYLWRQSGKTSLVYFYGNADRTAPLSGSEWLAGREPLRGPIELDHLPLYDGGHWLPHYVTEHNHETDQLNVYDSLYKQLSVDYEQVPAAFKRPFLPSPGRVQLSAVDELKKALNLVGFDPDHGYYVIAPTSTSRLRSAPAGFWIDLSRSLLEKKPRRAVIMVGTTGDAARLDVQLADLRRELAGLGVVDLVDQTTTSDLSGIVSQASCVFCLDSGPLYLAQAYRVPAVSIWGTHHPGCRLAYDEHYLELAVFNQGACPHAPCYAYNSFPRNLCPRGQSQDACEPLMRAPVNECLDKLELVERRSSQKVAGPFRPAKG